MPWRDLLSPAQRAQVMALPTSLREYEELYTLTPADQEFVTVHRTNANRLGVAVQLCFLRHPGRAWAPEETMPVAMLRFIAQQVGAEPVDLLGYAERDQTRREHAIEMMREYGFTTFGVRDYRTLSSWLTEQARGTDNGLALVTLLISVTRPLSSARSEGLGRCLAQPCGLCSPPSEARSVDLARGAIVTAPLRSTGSSPARFTACNPTGRKVESR